MAPNKQELLKQWIQFLKGMQIVALQSDPKTGKLSYNRQVTADDVTKFLEVKTDFTPEQISNAIHIVLSKQAINKANPKLGNNPQSSDTTQSGNQVTTQQSPDLTEPENQQQSAPKNKDSEKDTTKFKRKNPSPGSIRVRGNRTIHEEISDPQPHSLDERDVESVFDILSSGESNKATNGQRTRNGQERQQGSAKQQEVSPEKKEEDIRKLKRLIRDTMTPVQRKSLWRALNE